MAKEIWRWILGYIGFYKISNIGRVRRTKSFTIHWITGRGYNKLRKVRLLKGIIEPFFYGKVRGGNYMAVSLSKPGQPSRTHRVAQLVLESFIGPCPLNKMACHKDDNPQN